MRTNEIYGVITIAIFFLILIAYNKKPEEQPHYAKHSKYTIDLYDEDVEELPNTSTIKDIVEFERNAVQKSMWNYKFAPGISLRNYTLHSGGSPIRNIIVTTWRSGSTFLGDVINAVPGTFYHYEPLLEFGIVQIRGAPHAQIALRNIKNLLNCDYSDMQSYLEFGQSHNYLFTHNKRLWDLCEAFPHFCWDPAFLSEVCKQFPFQSLKTVRLRARLSEELLQDEKLNVKVLLLIRDPRGTLQSRKHRDWCPGEPDCEKPNLLCADMVADYSAAIKLAKLYPGRFRVIRYEDLSLDPYNQIKGLFAFFGLDFHRNVREFLDSHTRKDAGGVSSTFRDSKTAPFHWRFDLNFTEVQQIQADCDEAMQLWGYAKIHNETHQRSFNPLSRYAIH